jgi:hypothetical protein
MIGILSLTAVILLESRFSNFRSAPHKQALESKDIDFTRTPATTDERLPSSAALLRGFHASQTSLAACG